MFVKMNDT